jgi:hypothetical protein
MNTTHNQNKIYKKSYIILATVLGGALAAATLLATNYKTFHKKTAAIATIIVGILLYALSMYLVFNLPTTSIFPKILLPLVSLVTALIVYHKTQAQQVQNHLQAQGKTYPSTRAVAITVLSFILTFVPIIVHTINNKPIINNAFKSYGRLHHEIKFNPENMDVEEVDDIAKALTEVGFLGDELKLNLYAEKEEDYLYVLKIELLPLYYNNPEVIEAYRYLQSDIQQHLSIGRLVIDLKQSGSFNNEYLRIE